MVEFKHTTLKSGRVVKRYKANCASCGLDRGYKDKNHLHHDCNQCANKEIGKKNLGLKRSDKTKRKQSIADCLFNYSSFDDADFKRSWSLSNLRPMWAKDNLSKGVNNA